MMVTASALISTSFDSASVINVPSASVCCGGQHTEWPVCLGSVIYFVIKRPGCTEWHQISLSTIQSRYIIQQQNNGCEHRRKRCGSLDMTLTCVNRKAQKHQMDVHRATDGGTQRPEDGHTGVKWTDQTCIILTTVLDFTVRTEACLFDSSGFLSENIGPPQIKKQTKGVHLWRFTFIGDNSATANPSGTIGSREERLQQSGLLRVIMMMMMKIREGGSVCVCVPHLLILHFVIPLMMWVHPSPWGQNSKTCVCVCVLTPWSWGSPWTAARPEWNHVWWCSAGSGAASAESLWHTGPLWRPWLSAPIGTSGPGLLRSII